LDLPASSRMAALLVSQVGEEVASQFWMAALRNRHSFAMRRPGRPCD
jgi:hypothetical protein